MVVIETQEQLEMYAWDIKNNMPYIPENARFLIIVEPGAFNNLVKQMSSTSAPRNPEPDRFIYHSQAGVEFGVKKGSDE